MHVPRTFRGLLAHAMLFGVLGGMSAGTSHAQWVQTNGPKGGSVRSFLAVPNGAGGTSLYAGGVRVWRTDDPGRELDASPQRPDGPQRLCPSRRAEWVGRQRHSGRHRQRRLSIDQQRRELEPEQYRNPCKPLHLFPRLGSQRLGGNEPVRRSRGLPGASLSLDQQRRELDVDQLRPARRPGQRQRPDDHGIGDGSRRNHERHLSLDELRRELDPGVQLLRVLLREARHDPLCRDQQRRLALDQRRRHLDRDQQRHVGSPGSTRWPRSRTDRA